MIRFALTTLCALLAFLMPVAGHACTDQEPCQLGDRSYHVKLPDDWDGVTPMPVMLHFHGWARQGTLIVKHSRISGATRKRGVLLLAPNGLNKSWDFWQPGSSDTVFAAAVLEDAAAKYPIDRSQIFVSGYSWGSNMAWRYACENGDGLRALLAVSGTLSQSEPCETRPQEVRHVHGLKDNVLDFPFGPDGDTGYAVKLWRDLLDCGPETTTDSYATTERDQFTRTIWNDCNQDTAGSQVILDTHPRGHFIPRGWFARQLDELLKTSS
ncbi:MAG: polyhydroxybutyrate depolymerase [Pseudomonadota bacterium]